MSKSWRYHRNHEPRIWEDHDLERAAEEGWVDSPAKVNDHLQKAADTEPEPPAVEPVEAPKAKKPGRKPKARE